MLISPQGKCIHTQCNRSISKRVTNRYGKQYYCDGHIIRSRNSSIELYGIHYTSILDNDILTEIEYLILRDNYTSIDKIKLDKFIDVCTRISKLKNNILDKLCIDKIEYNFTTIETKAFVMKSIKEQNEKIFAKIEALRETLYIQQEKIRKKEKQLLQDKRIWNNHRREILKEYRLFLVLKNTKECMCCYCEYEKDELYSCSNISETFKHIVCKHCFERHIQSNLNEGKASLCCMFDASEKCGGVYSEEIIERVLSNTEKYNRFQELQQINYLKQLCKTIENFQICPFCSRYGLQVNEKNRIEVHCQECDKSWCNHCKGKYHEEKGCYYFDIEEKSKTEQHETIRNVLNEIVSKCVLNTCPHCNAEYVKSEGCNLIHCSQCDGLSCDCCGDKLVPKHFENGNVVSKYYHFKGNQFNDGTTNCPLYYNSNIFGDFGNKSNKEKKIMNELKVCINANKYATNYIQDLLYNEIKLLKERTENYTINIDELYPDKKYSLVSSIVSNFCILM